MNPLPSPGGRTVAAFLLLGVLWDWGHDRKWRGTLSPQGSQVPPSQSLRRPKCRKRGQQKWEMVDCGGMESVSAGSMPLCDSLEPWHSLWDRDGVGAGGLLPGPWALLGYLQAAGGGPGHVGGVGLS